ncbi:hypothetical protein ABK040_005196 [Willaertia magna]
MSGVGTGFDLSVTVYSPDGRLYQIEYANKAVESSGTVLGICCKDGVVLAVEKLIDSKLQEESTNTRIFNVDRHAGMCIAGWKPDSRPIVHKARNEAKEYIQQYGHRIPGKILNERLSSYVHFFTMYMDSRPLGITSLLATYDHIDNYQLFQIEPSGESWGYRACAVGKGRQAAKTELEKLNIDQLSVKDALKEAARIIYHVHDNTKDRPLELELSWISKDSNFEHRRVPKDLFDEAENYAKESTKKSTTTGGTTQRDEDEELTDV